MDMLSLRTFSFFSGVDEAKDAMFKLLSQMMLSQVDFKRLLIWMKSLRLIPGKGGTDTNNTFFTLLIILVAN